MNALKLVVLLFLVLSYLVGNGVCSGSSESSPKTYEFYDGLVNARAQMITYLTNAVTKHLITTEIKNIGTKPSQDYFIAVPKQYEDKLARVQVRYL